jgi:hypothetical protein
MRWNIILYFLDMKLRNFLKLFSSSALARLNSLNNVGMLMSPRQLILLHLANSIWGYSRWTKWIESCCHADKPERKHKDLFSILSLFLVVYSSLIVYRQCLNLFYVHIPKKLLPLSFILLLLLFFMTWDTRRKLKAYEYEIKSVINVHSFKLYSISVYTIKTNRERR